MTTERGLATAGRGLRSGEPPFDELARMRAHCVKPFGLQIVTLARP